MRPTRDRVEAFFSFSLFGIGRKRTLEMCRVLGERRFTFGLESRVDILTPDLIAHLHQAGMEIICWGIESASPATLMRMNKVRSASEAKSYLSDTRAVLKACFENDVVLVMNFMLGFPGDTVADLEATLEFVKEVGQIHDQVAAQTGFTTGFAPFAQRTAIYEGSLLAERVAKDFPGTVIGPTSYDGEISINLPSPGLDLDTIRHYEDEINSLGDYTSKPELFDLYSTFSPKDFAAAHPELTDEAGITVLCGDLQQFPPY